MPRPPRIAPSLTTAPLALTVLLALAAPLTLAPAHARTPAHPAETRTLCVFDPSGANGQIFQLMKDFALEVMPLGVRLDARPYTDEATAARDLQAGQCDAALLTGTRVRPFHRFASTLEALGALPDEPVTRHVLQSLARPAATALMRNGDYEIGGLFPGGSVYLFVSDRALDSVGALAGRKIATLSHDEAARTMVERVGAAATAADVGTFAGLFNNGSVDICYAPAYAYEALELHKGIGAEGGIIRYPVAQLTMQLILRAERFPGDFGARARALASKHFDRALELSRTAEARIPAGHWIDIPAADRARYDDMLRDVRVALRDGPGIYDATALRLLRKARCKQDAARAECALKVE